MQLQTLRDEMTLRNFSRRTVRAYMFANERFLEFVRKPADEVTQKDVNTYLLYLAGKELKPATRHLVTASLKFYYCGILKRKFRFIYPKLGKHLPDIVSRENVLQMIDATFNLKHKLLIVLLYSSGLRVGEAVKLKLADIDITNGCIFVNQGKGSKDRVVIASRIFLKMLNQFITARAKKSSYVFYSERNDRSHISIKTAQKIVEIAAIKTGIRTHCHALRSSFATHLLENGTDVHYVQRLLGHSSIQSTQGYLRVANSSLLKVKSPMDINYEL